MPLWVYCYIIRSDEKEQKADWYKSAKEIAFAWLNAGQKNVRIFLQKDGLESNMHWSPEENHEARQ